MSALERKFFECLYGAIRLQHIDNVIKLCTPLPMRTLIRERWHLYEPRSPLLEALLQGVYKLVVLFHQFIGINPASLTHSSESPIHHAVKLGKMNIVTYLIQEGRCDPGSLIRHTLVAPIHSATRRGQTEAVRFLIHEAKVEPLVYNKLGQSPMHIAAENGYFDLVQLYDQLGCFDYSIQDKGGKTPLELACKAGHTDIVQLIAPRMNLDSMHDPINKCTKSVLVSCLAACSEQGHLSILKFLVTSAIQPQTLPEILTRDEQFQILRLIVSNGYDAVLQFMLRHVSADQSTLSALFRTASSNGRIPTMQFLLHEYKQAVLFSDASGRSALHAAAHALNMKSVRFLIDTCHLDPHTKTIEGDTALHFAVRSRNAAPLRKFEVIQYLATTFPLLVSMANGKNEAPFHLIQFCSSDKQLLTHVHALFETVLASQTKTASKQQPFTNAEKAQYAIAMNSLGVMSLPEWSDATLDVYATCIQKAEELSKARQSQSLPQRTPTQVAQMLWLLTKGTGEMEPVYKYIMQKQSSSQSKRSSPNPSNEPDSKQARLY